MSEEIIDKYKTLKELQEENKQLKEQLDVHKILLQTNAPSTCILTELEEYMKENEGMYIFYAISRLQELKEKYK